jgi:hypothetical protein
MIESKIFSLVFVIWINLVGSIIFNINIPLKFKVGFKNSFSPSDSREIAEPVNQFSQIIIEVQYYNIYLNICI